jgi:HTH-type transcriptional regulator/antitoxin HigA
MQNKRHMEYMKTIETQEQYDKAIHRIEELYRQTDEDTSIDNPLMIELDELGRMVEQYEDVHYPISKPSLVATIKLRMYEMGISQKKLAELLQISQSRLSAYLNGKSVPSLKTARRISQSLNIDADIVLGV